VDGPYGVGWSWAARRLRVARTGQAGLVVADLVGLALVLQLGKPIVHLGPFVPIGRTNVICPHFDLHVRLSSSARVSAAPPGSVRTRRYSAIPRLPSPSDQLGFPGYPREAFTVLNKNNDTIKF
jgi:hypothetical protein